MFAVLGMIAAACLAALPAERAEAAGATWTQLFPGPWVNCRPALDNCSDWWSVDDPMVQINYYVTVSDAQGTVLPPGSSVSQGSVVNLAFSPHRSEDVYWFSTGGSFGSPYGEWRGNAAAPPSISCSEKDYVWTDVHGDRIHAPLVVHPPEKSITRLDNMTCGALAATGNGGYQMQCIADTLGPVSPVFNFGNTYGVFYFRIQVPLGSHFSGRMRWNRVVAGGYECGYIGSDSLQGFDGVESIRREGIELPKGADYGESRFIGEGRSQIDVPPQSVRYPLVVVANGTPLPPTVSSSGNCTAGAAATYRVQATDPDGDRVRYGIDWNNNGVVDEWSPDSGYVDSGSERTISRTWSESGPHTFRVLAQDEGGATSAWSAVTDTCDSTAPGRCPSGYTLQNGLCTAVSCPLGYALQNGQCVSQCPSGYVRQGNQCIRSECPSGYTLQNNRCVATVKTCPLVCSGKNLVNSCTGQVVQACSYQCSAGACVAAPPPEAALTAQPLLVRSGETTTIRWSATNVDSCSVTGTNGDSWTSGEGAFSQISGPIMEQTIYTLLCAGLDGSSINESRIVNTVPMFQEL